MYLSRYQLGNSIRQKGQLKEFKMSTQLPPYKASFLKAAISGGVLKFGSFELKSKRISPYFFNAGDFYRADLLRAISIAYASAIIEAREQTGLEFDIVFGPAYKGIPLATSTTDKLAELDPANYSQICYSFDRKEAKDHGEGGNIVGAPLKGRKVLIVDDVITAGTAKREAIGKIRKEGGEVVGIVVALDRMEKLPSPDGDDGKPMPSAIGEIRKEYGIPIFAILTLDDIIEGMKGCASEDDIRRTEEYRRKYKASD
jgi:orotate phosphoribosyltransferase